MRISLPTTFRNDTFRLVLTQPFYLLLFLYFFTLSGDLLNVTLFFRFKLTNLVGIAIFSLFVCLFQKLCLYKDFFLVWVGCLSSLVVSACFGYHFVSCSGFIAFFVFNYFVYFVFSASLYSVFSVERILHLYFLSFVSVGVYAACQVFASFGGVILPFVGQMFGTMARGQGFSYEPSYYALYMTPFVIFQTAKFLLQRPENRRLRDVVVPNFLLLVSTSTGCFFTYLAFFAWLAFMKRKWIKQLSILKLLLKFAGISTAVCGLIWIVEPRLIKSLFLKFFFVGFTAHYSFNERWTMLVKYWNVFLDHFWIGTGLGGAMSYLLMLRGGEEIQVLDRDVLQDPTLFPTNVTTEILASLGMVGGVMFALLLWIVWRTFLKALRLQGLTEEEKIHLLAFAASLCVTFFTLQFNSSIMRCYLWVHLGVSVGYAKHLRIKYQSKGEEALIV